MTQHSSIPITPSVLEEWRAKEYGSWEDHGCPDTGHVYVLLQRRKTTLRWETPDELRQLEQSATHQTSWDASPFTGAMERVVRKLREVAP